MMSPRIVRVAPVGFGVVHVEYDDGFVGDYDLTEAIATWPILERLRDPAYFSTVAVSAHGHSFGWNLDDIGNEIDFGAESTRADLEAQEVGALAGRFESHPAK